VFDVISVLGRHQPWARDFFHAGTYVFVGGAAVSVLAALTGFWDWWRASEKGTQARRTINTHAWAMITVTVLALVDIALRLGTYNTRAYPDTATWILSVVVTLLVSFGAVYGGSLVYEYGFNLETAGEPPRVARLGDRRLPRPALSAAAGIDATEVPLTGGRSREGGESE
jgi:uncharacterized membrane protein